MSRKSPVDIKNPSMGWGVFNRPVDDNLELELTPYYQVVCYEDWLAKVAGELSDVALKKGEELSIDTPAVLNYLPNQDAETGSEQWSRPASERIVSMAKLMSEKGNFLPSVIEVADLTSVKRVALGIAVLLSGEPTFISGELDLDRGSRIPVLNINWWRGDDLSSLSLSDEAVPGERDTAVELALARALTEQAFSAIKDEESRLRYAPYVLMSREEAERSALLSLGLFVPTKNTGQWKMSGLDPSLPYTLHVLSPDITDLHQLAA